MEATRIGQVASQPGWKASPRQASSAARSSAAACISMGRSSSCDGIGPATPGTKSPAAQLWSAAYWNGWTAR